MKTITLVTVLLLAQLSLASSPSYETGPIKITPALREALGTTKIQNGVRIEAMDLNQLRESLRNTKGKVVLQLGEGNHIELERELEGNERPGVVVGSGGAPMNSNLIDMTDGLTADQATRVMFVIDDWSELRTIRPRATDELVKQVSLNVYSERDGLGLFSLRGEDYLKPKMISYIPNTHIETHVAVEMKEIESSFFYSDPNRVVSYRDYFLSVPQLVPIKKGVLNIVPIRQVKIRFSDVFQVRSIYSTRAETVLSSKREKIKPVDLVSEPFKEETFFFFPGKYELSSRGKKLTVEIN